MKFECKRDVHRYIRVVARFIHQQFKIDDNTNFCIDTGSPGSVLSYEQAVKWQLPLNQLQQTPTPWSVGGIQAPAYILKDSKILLRNHLNKLCEFPLTPVIVLGPAFAGRKLPVPALLGDEFLRRFTLIVEADNHGGHIFLTDDKINI